MEFALTTEQREIQDRARQFADEEVAPLAREADELHEFPVRLVRHSWRSCSPTPIRQPAIAASARFWLIQLLPVSSANRRLAWNRGIALQTMRGLRYRGVAYRKKVC
jgi:hypothetical protein